ncbi:conjugative transposon protein TraN [Dyadobacter sp. 3J3]|uniref:conjugative transposon protein TraN n=1 Tax=Dyadobacter sp. 3J3 TaxID=2606600 RepID=UPI00135A19FF|nr:conjugative transposon protein TraN [Dyadobacter sp. 3J3]
MKKNRIGRILALLLLVISGKAFSQNVELFVIEPFPLEITYHKTVNLIFPFAIKSVDRGSRDILAQKAKGIENILQIKAARKGFIQTNLTVVTSDGKLYSFVVTYADEPLQLNIELIPDKNKSSSSALFQHSNQAVIQHSSELALSDKNNLHRIKDRCDKARFALSGLYIREDVIFYRLQLENHSNITYDIENLRFFIRDKKRVKRAAVQEREIMPVYVHQDTAAVGAKSFHVFVFAIDKFTIPNQKQLTIQLMEKNGGRHMELQVQNRAIVRAKPLS